MPSYVLLITCVISQLTIVDADAAENFCLRIIENTRHCVAAFKPNIAFFEALGPPGLSALQRVIGSIPAEIPVILDCKRGDIDTSAQAYAKGCFDNLNAGAVTVNAYMGLDTVLPFTTGDYQNKGVFVICKSSNPSAQVGLMLIPVT